MKDFIDTSEYVYLHTLCELMDALIGMIGRDELTDEQIKTLTPQLNQANDILNADIRTLETNRETLN